MCLRRVQGLTALHSYSFRSALDQSRALASIIHSIWHRIILYSTKHNTKRLFLLIFIFFKRFISLPVPPSVKAVNQLVGAPVESHVTLQCLVEVFPKPLNGWYRNDGKLSSPSVIVIYVI